MRATSSDCKRSGFVARFVFEYKDWRLESLYFLREDCVPLKIVRHFELICILHVWLNLEKELRAI
jgi:hypothetical protein